jgi:hypothetical protein
MTESVLAWYHITRCYIPDGSILQLFLITTLLRTLIEGSCSQPVGHRPLEVAGLLQAVCCYSNSPKNSHNFAEIPAPQTKA